MPMQVHTYEHPVISRVRRVVRQVFLCWLIASVLVIPLGIWEERNFDVAHRNIPEVVFGSFFIGALVAIPLWLLYRLIRFAIG